MLVRHAGLWLAYSICLWKNHTPVGKSGCIEGLLAFLHFFLTVSMFLLSRCKFASQAG